LDDEECKRSGIPALKELIAGADVDKRRSAYWVLGEIRREGLAGLLLGGMLDPDPYVRGMAVEGIEKMGDKASIKMLIPYLGDKEEFVRKKIKDLLIRYINELLDDILAMSSAPDKNIRANIALILGEAADEPLAIERLIRLLSDSSHEAAINAVRAFRKFKPEEALEPLIKLFDSSGDNSIRFEILTTFVKYKDGSLSEFFIRELNNQDNRIRAAALEGLDSLNNAEFIPHFLNMSDDMSPRAAGIAGRALYKLKHEKGMKILNEMIFSKDKAIKISGIFNAGEANAKESIKALLNLAKDKDVDIKRNAQIALNKMSYMDANLFESILSEREGADKISGGGLSKAAIISGDEMEALSETKLFNDFYNLDMDMQLELLSFLLYTQKEALMRNIFDRYASLDFPEEKKEKIVEIAVTVISRINDYRKTIEVLYGLKKTKPVKSILHELSDKMDILLEIVFKIMKIVGEKSEIELIEKRLKSHDKMLIAYAIEVLETVGHKKIVKELVPIIERLKQKKGEKEEKISHAPLEGINSLIDLTSSQDSRIRTLSMLALKEAVIDDYRVPLP